MSTARAVVWALCLWLLLGCHGAQERGAETMQLLVPSGTKSVGLGDSSDSSDYDWKLGDAGQSCDDVCAANGGTCLQPEFSKATDNSGLAAVIALANHTCVITDGGNSGSYPGVYTPNNMCYYKCSSCSDPSVRECASWANGVRRFCPCSRPTPATTPSCQVSAWSAFSKICSAVCGGGEQHRTRTIIRDGNDCPVLTEKRACNQHSCSEIRVQTTVSEPWDVSMLQLFGTSDCTGSPLRVENVAASSQSVSAAALMNNVSGTSWNTSGASMHWIQASMIDDEARLASLKIRSVHGAPPITLLTRNLKMSQEWTPLSCCLDSSIECQTINFQPPAAPAAPVLVHDPSYCYAATERQSGLLKYNGMMCAMLRWDATPLDKSPVSCAAIPGCSVAGYQILWSVNGLPYEIRVNNTGSTDTELMISGLREGNRYNFRVRAINKGGWSLPSEASDMATAPSFPTTGQTKTGLCVWNGPQKDPDRKWATVCREHDGTSRDACLSWQRAHYCSWHPTWSSTANMILHFEYKEYRIDFHQCKAMCETSEGCWKFSHTDQWDQGTTPVTENAMPAACRIPAPGYGGFPSRFFHGSVYVNSAPIVEWDYSFKSDRTPENRPVQSLETVIRGTGAAIESSVLHLTGGAYGYSKIPPSLAIEEFSVEVVAKDDNMDSTCYHASLECEDLNSQCSENWLDQSVCGTDSYWRAQCPKKCGMCLPKCDMAVVVPEYSQCQASSFRGGDSIGTGRGQGLLDSPLAWIGAVQEGEWWQMDLGSLAHVAGVVTQGRADPPHDNQYVTSYTVRVSGDSRTWVDVDDGRVFAANTGGGDAKVENEFRSPVFAQYVRIVVKTWNLYPSMRAGLMLCDGEAQVCGAPSFHDNSKCRIFGSGFDPHCCAAPHAGYCAGGTYVQGPWVTGNNTSTCVHTCCLPKTVLVQDHSSLVSFSSLGDTLEHVGIASCGGEFKLMASTKLQERVEQMRKVLAVDRSSGQLVHLVLTSTGDGEVKLYQEGKLIESFKARPLSADVKNQAAFLLGTAPKRCTTAPCVESMSPQDIDAIGGDNFAGDVQLARFYPVALGEGRVVDIHKAYAKQRIATRSSYEVGVKSIA